MFPRSRKQKIDYEQIRQEAYALIDNALESQGPGFGSYDFCSAVQQGLNRYQDIPYAERTLVDWRKILSTCLYIFSRIGDARLYHYNRNLDDISDAVLIVFNNISDVLAKNEYVSIVDDHNVKITLACVRACILACVKCDDDPARLLEVYEAYCLPAQEVLLPESGELVGERSDADYLSTSLFNLGMFFKAMGRLDLAKQSVLTAIAQISTRDDLSWLMHDLFVLYGEASKIVAPHLDGLAMHPLKFVKTVYSGSASFDQFAIVCEGVVSMQDREPDLSRFFVQALGLIHKHLDLEILPESNFQQHLQHDHFRATFDSYLNLITERHMALQDMLLNHNNVQVGLLGEVVGLRARVKQLEEQLESQQKGRMSAQSLFRPEKVAGKSKHTSVNHRPVTRSQTLGKRS